MSVGIVIATFGSQEWFDRANAAVESAEAQTMPCEVIHIHLADGTLAEARNAGAQRLSTDWLIFLDGDDTLDRRYVAAMTEWMGDQPLLLQPSTLGVHVDGREDPEPVLIPQRPLNTGNFMVIGTAMRRDQFFKVGGFRERPMYEDWCLFIRMWKDGAAFQPVPDAIYRVSVNENGRNSQDRKAQETAFRQIHREYFKS